MGNDARRQRGPYAGTAARRLAILDAASEVFARSGYHGGSMRDVAERLGVSHTTLLHHFSSKSELLLGVLARRDEQSPIVQESETGTVAVLARLIEMVEHNQRTPGLVELFCVLSAEATDREHPAHEFFRRRYRMVVDHLRVALTEMSAHGGILPGLDPLEEARKTVALMDGLQVQWLLDREGIDMAAIMRRHVNGLLTAPHIDAAREEPDRDASQPR